MINIFLIDVFIIEIIMNILCMFVMFNIEIGIFRRDRLFRKRVGLFFLVK